MTERVPVNEKDMLYATPNSHYGTACYMRIKGKFVQEAGIENEATHEEKKETTGFLPSQKKVKEQISAACSDLYKSSILRNRIYMRHMCDETRRKTNTSMCENAFKYDYGSIILYIRCLPEAVDGSADYYIYAYNKHLLKELELSGPKARTSTAKKKTTRQPPHA